MRYYTVIITRDTTESATLTIEAYNEAEAESLILGLVRRDPNDLAWHLDDTPNASSDIYVTDIQEA